MQTRHIWQHIKTYLQQQNDTVLLLHLNNATHDPISGETHDSGHANVEQNFQNLQKALETCQQQLANLMSAPKAELVSILLAIYTDEDILTSGLYPRQHVWPKLQSAYLGHKEGGIVFFELLDNTLNQPGTTPLILEVFYYCLRQGFKGRYHQDPARLKYYTSTLAAIADKPGSKRFYHDYVQA